MSAVTVQSWELALGRRRRHGGFSVDGRQRRRAARASGYHRVGPELILAVRWDRLALLACTLLLAVPVLPLRAGGGVVMTDQGCTMHIDFYSARFTAYQPESRGNAEFCEDLPDTGPTVFVLDYLHASLKLVPVDFRIIRNVTGQGRFAKWEDVATLGDLEPHTLYYHPPVVRPDASFQVEYDFADEGEYIGIVTAGHPTNDQTYRAVFPFEVGRRSPWGPALGLLLVGAVAALLWRRRKARSGGMVA